MKLNFLTLAAGIMTITVMVCTGQAQGASQAQIEQLSTSIQGDAAKAKLFLQSFLETISDGTTVLDCSVFVPQTVAGIDYLVAKAFVTENNVQSRARAVVYFNPRAGAALLSERVYQYFLESGDEELLRAPDLDPES
jgi:hypothetical protein